MRIGQQIALAQNIDERELQTYINELNRNLREKVYANECNKKKAMKDEKEKRINK